MNGRISSIQSLGAVDGPGVRYTVFLQGCPLRCSFCHNPDTWSFDGGTLIGAQDLFSKILRYRDYFGKNGGITVTGGEPLSQMPFVTELFKLCKGAGIHTAIDTSGIHNSSALPELLVYTDLVMCDLKFTDNEAYINNCGASLDGVLEFLSKTQKLQVPLWIRHVVIPEITDSRDNINKLIAIASQYSNLEKIELLPFRKLCVSKYEAMGIPFRLKDVPECSAERLDFLKELIPDRYK